MLKQPPQSPANLCAHCFGSGKIRIPQWERSVDGAYAMIYKTPRCPYCDGTGLTPITGREGHDNGEEQRD